MSPPRQSEEPTQKTDGLLSLSRPEDLLNEAPKDGDVGQEGAHKSVEKHEVVEGTQSTTLTMEGNKADTKDEFQIDTAAGVPIEAPDRSDEAQASSSAGDSAPAPLTPIDIVPATVDPMESSTATLRPDPPKTPVTETPYLDPTPKTPMASTPVSRSTSSAASIPYSKAEERSERSPTRSDVAFDEKPSMSEDGRDSDSRSEIQSIMDQFSEEGGGPGVEEVMSPRLEFAGPLLGTPIQHPPRKSSLEPLNAQTLEDLRLGSASPPSQESSNVSEKGPAVPPKSGSLHAFSPSRIHDDRSSSKDGPMSPVGASLHRPPPPEPEPEPDLPFDFHRFLEQLRHRTADPVAKFLRSFLTEFGKKQWMVHEQVKIIGDFLAFITNKMAQCEVWREVSDAEFDNAREGMEKLVMNRLYTQTFSPAIPPPQPIPGSRSKRKSMERPMGPGRRGQHQEDVERDDILAQKVSIYGWVKEEHLDIEPVGDSGKRFLVLAQQGQYKHKISQEYH